MLPIDVEDDAAHGGSRRTPRFAAITVGVMIQLLTGTLLFTVPPGGSVMTWLLYIALGIVGLVHILMGAVLWRDSPDAIAPTAFFESDDIPWHAKRCPVCDCEIADALQRGGRRCPHCDAHFSTRDLGWRDADHAGEPASLSPHERRMSGAHLVTLLAGMTLIFIVLAVIVGLVNP